VAHQLQSAECAIGAGETDAALEMAEGDCLRLSQYVDQVSRAHLYYMSSMLYARFSKPRNFDKGEEHLNLGLELTQTAGLSDSDACFHQVFNRNGLAMIRHFQGRFQEAMDICSSGIRELDVHLSSEKHRLHRSILYYNVAQVYMAVGATGPAIENFSAAISMDPNYSEYYNERGNIHFKMGRLEEARADYLKAIDLSAPYYEVFTNLGHCSRLLGASAEAVQWYSRSLDLETDQAPVLLGRAQAYQELEKAEAAIADYSAALAFGAGGWEAFANRGAMFYALGDLRSTIDDLDRAIQLAPDQPDIYSNLAIVIEELAGEQELVPM